MSTPRADDPGQRQADYFREVLGEELIQARRRVAELATSLSDLIGRDGPPMTVQRHRKALKAAVANGRRVTEMLEALDRKYPGSATAVAS